jgi:probable DNA repair protein
MLIGTDPGAELLQADALHGALAGGATVVTATRRLARRLVADHAGFRGVPSWPTPDVLPWGAWLGRAYRSLRDHGVLAEPRPVLEEAQAAAIWEVVLREDPQARSLLMPAGAASECREAWRLVHDWELPAAEMAARGGEDCRLFVALAETYRRRVEDAGFVDPASLPALVARHAPGLGEHRVLFHGFERLPPALRRVMDALGGRAGLAVPARAGPGPRVMALPDPATELRTAVAWARERLAANPAAKIGIVVPDVAAQAGLIRDLLDEALAPERLLPAGLDGVRPWNVSLGSPLAEAPVVAAALLSLSAGSGELSWTHAGRLLRSPYLGEAGSEAGPRAALDAWLRGHAGESIPAGRLAGWARRGPAGGLCPGFAARLSGLLDVLWAPPRRRAASGWAEAFARALRAAGWPGEASLDSAEYQATAAWAETLDALAGLDAVVGPMPLAEALGRVRRMVSERLFQPESGDAPVQVMGLLETPGQTFDALWVTGLHDGVLPTPLRPCPLIPVSMQRERGMPRSLPEAELELARAWVRRLGTSAPEVVMSWPARQEEEPLRASPVLRGLPGFGETIPDPVSAASAQLAVARMEPYEDGQGEPVAGEVRGGTGLLKAQSACPFQAYGRYRLGCEPLDEPVPGIDPMTRGALVHDALRRFWEETGNSAALAAMDPSDRRGRIRSALQAAADELQAARDQPIPEHLMGIEIAQCVARLEELAGCDLDRPAFTVVRLEEWLELSVGGLKLRGRVDRVDEAPGGFVVIDYKAGEGRRADWAGERPREPQLPVYAINLNDVVAIAFGNLKPGNVGYQGLARDGDIMGAVGPARKDDGPEEWEALLEQWRHSADRLAQAVAEGDARVDPRDGRRTCEYCGLRVMCRREELAAGGAIRDD